VPFVIISQFNFEHDILHKNDIEIARKIFNRAKKVYFVAKRNFEVAERQLAYKLNNTEIIYNPTKTRGTGYLAYPALDATIEIACVARLDCSNKGQDILVEVLHQEKWKNKNWHLHLFGEGPDEEYLKMLVQYFKIENRVTLHGHVNDIKEVWQQCHLLILPSFGEGTPLAMIEAMLCGRPVIATNVGGIADWINDQTGYLVAAPIKEQIDSSLETAWNEQDKWETLGKNARKIVLEKFPESPEAFFYNKLISL
jgi:glycosyltransferase involved in cell wall biosynthesis